MLRNSQASESLHVQPGILRCFLKAAIKLPVLLEKLYLEIVSACGMPTQFSLSGKQALKE